MFGYLDPATGSMIVSAVVAGGAGASVAVKTMMAKFRFNKGKSTTDVEVGADEIVPQPTA